MTITPLGKLRGDSPYEIAVKNGFAGSEQEWLDSLQGEPGIITPELEQLRDEAAADAGRAETAREGAEAAYDEMGQVTSGGVAQTVQEPGPARDALLACFVGSGSLADGAGWGSSSIAGSGATSIANRLLGRLEAILGIPFYNGGQGGELVTHHAARSGAVPAIVTVPSGTIPASGAVTVVIENFTTGRLDRLRSFSGTLFGVPGTLAYAGGVVTFTRSSSGAQKRVPNRVPFIVDADVYRDRFTLLWPGKNTLVDTQDVAQVVEYTRRMAAHAPPRTLVLGHFVDRDESSGAVIAAIQAANAQYAIDYGERYVDVQHFLTSRFLWYVTGITPTSADLAAQQAGRKPPSVSADSYHLNDAGYAALAWLISSHVKELGWFPDAVLPAMPPEPVIPDPPAQVTGLTLARGDGQITALWNAVPLATSYTIEHRTGGFAWTAITGVAVTSRTITGLTNGALYEVRVTAVNADGSGPSSLVRTATPGVPTFAVYTSDGFAGDTANIVGRTSDAALGGTPVVWQSSIASAGAQALGGQMVRGESSSAQFLAWQSPSARQRVEAKMMAVPSVESFLVVRRQALTASDQYRLRLLPNGSAQIQVIAGGSTTNPGAAFSWAIGDVLGIEVNGSTITARKNGVVVDTITNSGVTEAGFAGIAIGTSASFAFDEVLFSALF